jgi:UDP-GlcNAc:undecaprenyl-phosphate GlcNAc-1-phosphate transferase
MPETVKLPKVPHAGPHSGGTVHMWGVLGGACWIAVVGVIDDIWELRPLIKLLGQIVAAVLVVEAGVVVTDVTLPFIGGLQFPNTGGVLTGIGLVFLMNVVNFSDGIDGLAAGVCAIAGATLAIIAFDLGRDAAGVLAAITGGAALGFLFWNFHPASVFMGDAGALLLGLLLGCTSVQGSVKTNAILALIFPLIVLTVPFLDTTFVVLKRMKYRRPVYSADRWHLHHRLSNIGFSQRRTVLYLYAWTLIQAGLALALRFVPYSDNGGQFYLGWTLVMIALGLVALAASVYLVYVLEIVKFRRRRPGASDEEVARELETGEFDALDSPRDP